MKAIEAMLGQQEDRTAACAEYARLHREKKDIEKRMEDLKKTICPMLAEGETVQTEHGSVAREVRRDLAVTSELIAVLHSTGHEECFEMKIIPEKVRDAAKSTPEVEAVVAFKHIDVVKVK